MPIFAALPVTQSVVQGADRILTFVVPAPKGCNLNCSFCFIRARKEQDTSIPMLTVEQYVAFGRAVLQSQRVSILSIQGYEGLLPESWPYTQALLALGQEFGVPTSIVTNGTFLGDRWDDLQALGVSSITVSLDSGTAHWHDLSRGVQGAFSATTQALRQLQTRPELREKTLLASVLQPRRHAALASVPALMTELGLKTWIVQPSYHTGVATGRYVESVDTLVPAVVQLGRSAKLHGIGMVVDDALAMLCKSAGHRGDKLPFEVRSLNDIDRIIRLSPNGDVATGVAVSRRMNPDKATRWANPSESNAAQFVSDVLARSL